MAHHSNGLSLLSLFLLGGALIVNEQGDLVGRAQERGSGIDLFDAHSKRLGWGREGAGGTVELFDTKGNRLGIWQRNRGVIRLEQK